MEHRWILAKVGDRTEQAYFPFCCFLSLLYLSLALCCTINMFKCLFSVVWQPSSMDLHLSEELKTFGGSVSPITPDCYHFTEDHSHRLSTLKEESGVYVSANHSHPDITAYTHTVYIYVHTCFDLTTCNTKFINQTRQAWNIDDKKAA